MKTSEKHLIIGAGFVGLGIAQALKKAGIAYDQVDASDAIGGNWYHGVYETAHIISSRRVTEFPYFPMPSDYPLFPGAKQILAYLHAFADHFDLRSHIELNCRVEQVIPCQNSLWQVQFQNQSSRIYRGIIICNGHHWCKNLPKFSGDFQGNIIHTKDYQHPEQLRGKRVLVIGGGNSACDVAAEAARVAQTAVLSLRESVWFIPKSFAGVPVTDLIRGWMPQWLQRYLVYTIIRLSFGKHQQYGLPRPNYPVFAKHPTLNDEVPYYIRQGRLSVKPQVAHLQGEEVEFSDGSRAPFDLIVCGTGYRLAYPFLPPELQRVKGSILNCYAGSFLSDYKGIYFIGWGQARGGVGSLVGAFGDFFTRCLKLQDEIGVPLGLVFKEMGQTLPTTHLSDPHQVFRRLKLAKLLFPLIVKKGQQLDRKYPHFQNPRLDG